MAHVAQMLTQEPIYKPPSIFWFKLILLSAHKLILLIYGDNSNLENSGSHKYTVMSVFLMMCQHINEERDKMNFKG